MKRLLLGVAALTAAASYSGGPARADDRFPWCAVVSLGTGNAYWDCQYRTVWECIPNVLAGNRGTCNPNPGWVGLSAPAPRPHSRHKRHARAY